jgi:predicted dehydrogenase
MQRGNFSRRGFVQSSLALLGAYGLPMWYARDTLAAFQQQSNPPSNDAIRIGCVGIGSKHSRGAAVVSDFRNQRKFPVRGVAVCDVDNNHLGRAATILQNWGYKEVTTYHDYRDLNDRKDLDAVIVATPDHWHALVAIDAMKKGKDVYCEKPLTLTVAEALAMEKVAAETGRVVATGSQQRSDSRFRLACELVRNGRIGKIKTIECRIDGNPTSGPIPKVKVPDGFDYDMWLGPCPMADYVDDGKHTRCHYEFRWWYEYSGGKMTDWGAHHLDIAQWALGKDGSGPTAVEVLKSTPPSTDPNAYNTHPEFQVQYTYPEGTKVTAMSGGGSGPHRLVDKDGNLPKRNNQEFEISPNENGVLFIGEDGIIFVNRGRILASDARLLSEPLPSSATKLEVSGHHQLNFLECMKSRQKPICSEKVGASSVIVCHIGVIALRTGKKLQWDPVAHHFDDAEANAMLSRPMRAPWKLDAGTVAGVGATPALLNVNHEGNETNAVVAATACQPVVSCQPAPICRPRRLFRR